MTDGPSRRIMWRGVELPRADDCSVLFSGDVGTALRVWAYNEWAMAGEVCGRVKVKQKDDWGLLMDIRGAGVGNIFRADFCIWRWLTPFHSGQGGRGVSDAAVDMDRACGCVDEAAMVDVGLCHEARDRPPR